MRVLAQRYRIVETLGSGGMSTVYLAESINLGSKWAIKELPKKAEANYDLLAEPNILKQLNHSALPRIVDIFEDEEHLYIIEDYIEGVPLDKQLHMRKSFDEATVIEWTKQLCGVLQYLHNHRPNPVIYRDLKPSNIIVSSDNAVKLIDFGIAREYKTDSSSDTSYMGTRGYAAPEQYGTSQTDARTDIYSLGVTMYHLLTGKSPNEPPYEFRMLRQLSKDFSEGIEFIVNKCVQSDPFKRYQSVAELSHDLHNIFVFNNYYKKQKVLEKVKYFIKTALLLSFAFTILCGISIMRVERKEKFDAFVSNGYESLKHYQFETAMQAFNSANSIEPTAKEGYLGLAQILLKQTNYQQCIDYLDEVAGQIAGLSDDGQYNYLKGTVYFENGKYPEAVSYMVKASAIDPANIEYARDVAVCYAKKGDVSQARETLNQLVALGSSNDVLDYVNGQVYVAEHKLDAAIGSFSKTISESNDQIIIKKAYIELASIYKRSRNTDKDALNNQIRVLERAEQELHDKDDLIITETLAEAYFASENYSSAARKFQKLLDIGYSRPYIYRNLAIIYQLSGDLNLAEKKLKEMKDKYSDDYKCYLQFAFLHLEKESRKDENSRDYGQVVEFYNLAVRYAPNGANSTDLHPLTNKIAELRQKGWL